MTELVMVYLKYDVLTQVNKKKINDRDVLFLKKCLRINDTNAATLQS